MINLNELGRQREKASEDKADLFDFYNKHWDALVAALTELKKKDNDLAEDLVDTFPGLKDGETAVNGGDLVDWLTLRLENNEIKPAEDPEEVCDECGNTIPFDENTVRDGDGSIANKHHDESCSLYDPDQE